MKFNVGARVSCAIEVYSKMWSICNLTCPFHRFNLIQLKENLMKVAYIFATNMAATFKLNTMILQQLERGNHGAEVIGMCVQLEAEAALLSEADRVEMLEGLGLGEGAWPRFVRAVYHLLGLRTYFTTGEKESRAWTFRAGSTAPECAGRIHTDFQRGFIRAETIGWDVLLEQGSWARAREFGLVRSEGKDYRPVDGDVMEFRFNV